MAKENAVILCGVAQGDATVKLGEDSSPVRGMLYIRVVDRTWNDGDQCDVQHTTVFVYSGNPKIIDKMMEIKNGDIVDVYGTLTTAKVPKNRKCPVCGSIDRSMGDITYVSPLYICRREHDLTPEKTSEILMERAEFSNRIFAIGNICAGLAYSDNNGAGNPKLQYQMAIPRTIRVHDGTANIETDYPWVFTTGMQAVEGKDALRIGSVIYIKGHLRSKAQSKDIKCSKCENVFTSPDFPLIMISPHFTEYLHNCNFPDANK